jgi:hypothetical protein
MALKPYRMRKREPRHQRSRVTWRRSTPRDRDTIASPRITASQSQQVSIRLGRRQTRPRLHWQRRDRSRQRPQRRARCCHGRC